MFYIYLKCIVNTYILSSYNLYLNSYHLYLTRFSCPITSWQIDGETAETVTNFILGGSKITADIKLKDAVPWKKSYDQPRWYIQKQRHYFANKGPSSQGYGFFSGHVWMWELDCEESWAPKNWCFWTVVLEKTLENSLDCKEIQPVHPKGNQSVLNIRWKDWC